MFYQLQFSNIMTDFYLRPKSLVTAPWGKILSIIFNDAILRSILNCPYFSYVLRKLEENWLYFNVSRSYLMHKFSSAYLFLAREYLWGPINGAWSACEMIPSERQSTCGPKAARWRTSDICYYEHNGNNVTVETHNCKNNQPYEVEKCYKYCSGKYFFIITILLWSNKPALTTL